MAAALGALCRHGGWSYAAIWRSNRRDPRLLTLGESYCEDEGRKVVERMLNQVHIVGEGIIGGALVSGKCQLIADDTSFGLTQTTSHADTLGLFQGYTWWQHQFLTGIKTIAVVPLQSLGVVQFGSMQKVSESSDFFKQVKSTFDQIESISMDLSTGDTQIDIFPYDQHFKLTSPSSMVDLPVCKVEPESKKLMGNIEITECRRSSVSSSNYSLRALNAFTSESGYGLNPHIVAMPVNSKSINAFKVLHNISNFPNHSVNPETLLQVKSSSQPDSSFASAISAHTSLNNLPRMEHEFSCDPNMLGDCLRSEKLLGFPSSSSSRISVGDRLKPILFDNATSCVSDSQYNCHMPPHANSHESSLLPDPTKSPSVLVSEGSPFYCKDSLDNSPVVQSDLMLEKNASVFTSQANYTVHVLPNRALEETVAGTMNSNIRRDNENDDLFESMMFNPSADTLMQDWWDDSVLLAGNLSHLGATATDSVTELTSNNLLSVEGRGFFPESVFEQLLGDDGNVGDNGNTNATCGPVVTGTHSLADCVSYCQLPEYTLQDCLPAYKAQVPPLIFPSSSCTSENAPNGSSNAVAVPLGNLSVDDCCSLNTANSKVSQPKKPEGVKTVKKRAKPGESTRPRPKDRQQIQDRVKELREIVPNAAKCSIDALLDRTIKHMLFLQSVTKYAEKIKRDDEPKMISKDSGAVLKDNSSGVVLKDGSSTGSNGGATWAYEVAGQTMVCPIIVEDLAPPGQMLVEMLCEERGFFLEIADNIRGFGLTILKGLMELRDNKIMARFLVEANTNVTRMDIFLSLVQLLQKNSLNRSTNQLTKIINSGVPSFAEHQQSPISIPVGPAERLQ